MLEHFFPSCINTAFFPGTDFHLHQILSIIINAFLVQNLFHLPLKTSQQSESQLNLLLFTMSHSAPSSSLGKNRAWCRWLQIQQFTETMCGSAHLNYSRAPTTAAPVGCSSSFSPTCTRLLFAPKPNLTICVSLCIFAILQH